MPVQPDLSVDNLYNHTLSQINDKNITLSLPTMTNDVLGFIVSPINKYVGYSTNCICFDFRGVKSRSKNIDNDVYNLSNLAKYNDRF